MSLRTLFAALVAIAVLFAPALTRAGEAFAAVPDHHAQMMTSGHCKSAPAGQDKSSDHDKAAGMTCCISMCMAVAVATPVPEAGVPVHDSVMSFSLTHRYHGLPAEIATPPPRFS